ncbi:MAG: DUF1016 domain-containing protein [Deltaproteobacteria bacterium]|nr:DUF1016 domain-containing protein [Deltaproteobacteria bacterium]
MSKIIETSINACIDRVREILSTARSRTLQTVNAAMISSYWEIGCEIVEEEQRGTSRAQYGDQLIDQLSGRLTEEFGRGFSVSNLRLIRQFYLTYSNRLPPIRYSVSSESEDAPNLAKRIGDSVSSELDRGANASILKDKISDKFSTALSWTHYRVLMRVENPSKRDFYEQECINAKWSVRELERQVSSMLFERLAKSRDKEGVLALTRKGHEVYCAEDLIKDPYVLEFTGLPESTHWLEGDLEQALIDRLQRFLLELGRDLFFVARQKRITIDGDHFYIDLVFYHRELKSFLLIDLKNGRLSQTDIGQMLLYTGYYEANEVRDGENPPIGLILCTDKNEAAVQYTLSQSASQVFASKYQLHLPSEEKLAEQIRRERQLLAQSKLE